MLLPVAWTEFRWYYEVSFSPRNFRSRVYGRPSQGKDNVKKRQVKVRYSLLRSTLPDVSYNRKSPNARSS